MATRVTATLEVYVVSVLDIIEGTKMMWHDHIGAHVNLYLGVEVMETENREVT
jgi:hypothetical protein